MRRRYLTRATALLLTLAACQSARAPGDPAPPQPSRSATWAVAAVNSLADTYVAEYFHRFPQWATVAGVATADHSRLADNSLSATAAWQQREDRWLTELRSIDTTALDRTATLTYGLLREQLEAAQGARVCRGELWSVSPTYTGWQSGLALIMAVQPTGSDSLRRAAVSRARALPRYLDTEIINLREGLRLGFSAPRHNVQVVIGQMDALLALPAEQSPFAAPATRDTAPGFGAELAAVVTNEIRPAIQRYRDFLADEYLGAARETVGVSAHPQGAACYQAAVRAHSSLQVPAREIHETGLREMANIHAQLREIGQRSFATSDAQALLRDLRADSRHRFASREELIATAQAAVDRARIAVPQWFGIVPRAPVELRPYAAFQERSAPPGQYSPASDDGTRPAVYWVNAYEATAQSRAGGLESIAFHETYPGHHLQIAIAKEQTTGHPISRYFGSSGFSEGWGLYSERLADEMGLFSSDVDRVGLLSSEAHRAARLVVDAGIHALGWSRQQAVDYMLANTALNQATAEAEIDRYIAVPGQATSYMLGSLEILRLREAARQRLGDRFDIREFHDRVLEDGAVTLAMLRAKIEGWLAGA